MQPRLGLADGAARYDKSRIGAHHIGAERKSATHIAVEVVELSIVPKATVRDGIVTASLDGDTLKILILVEMVGLQSHILDYELFNVVVGFHRLACELLSIESEQWLPVILIAEVSSGDGSRLSGIERLDGQLELRSTVGPLVGVEGILIIVVSVGANKLDVAVSDDRVIHNDFSETAGAKHHAQQRKNEMSCFHKPKFLWILV